MKRHLALALIAALGLFPSACAAPPPAQRPTPPSASLALASAAAPSSGAASQVDSSAVSKAVDGFGFDLLRALEKKPGRGSQTVISPLSVHADLAMVANGAGGETLAQMRSVLGLSGTSEADSNAAYASLLAQLETSGQATVAIANSLWIDTGFPVEPAFIDANKRYFGAEMRSLDLHTPTAVSDINGWVDSATKGKITKLLDSVPSADTRLYVINATYFKGDWISPFDAGETSKQPFHAPSGDANVDTMHQTDSWSYVQTPQLQAVELPYKGDRLCMDVILPSQNSSLDQLEASLTAEKFASIRSSMESTRVELSLPKTEVRWGDSLSHDLVALGMGDAFDPNAADFSRISSKQGLFIADVLHKTYLRVDEKGTEAAAVTSTRMGTTAMPVNPPVQMTVDRPYLMAIVDKQSGATLFLAAVRDPRAAN